MTQTLAGEEIIRVIFPWAQVREHVKYSSSNSYYINVELPLKGEGEKERNTYMNISLKSGSWGDLGAPKIQMEIHANQKPQTITSTP